MLAYDNSMPAWCCVVNNTTPTNGGKSRAEAGIATTSQPHVSVVVLFKAQFLGKALNELVFYVSLSVL